MPRMRMVSAGAQHTTQHHHFPSPPTLRPRLLLRYAAVTLLPPRRARLFMISAPRARTHYVAADVAGARRARHRMMRA